LIPTVKRKVWLRPSLPSTVIEAGPVAFARIRKTRGAADPDHARRRVGLRALALVSRSPRAAGCCWSRSRSSSPTRITPVRPAAPLAARSPPASASRSSA